MPRSRAAACLLSTTSLLFRSLSFFFFFSPTSVVSSSVVSRAPGSGSGSGSASGPDSPAAGSPGGGGNELASAHLRREVGGDPLRGRAGDLVVRYGHGRGRRGRRVHRRTAAERRLCVGRSLGWSPHRCRLRHAHPRGPPDRTTLQVRSVAFEMQRCYECRWLRW